jgi:AraC-like DNA-binding protein
VKCLELEIPPLPQFLKIGKSVAYPGYIHFKRNFGVYDLIYVKSGSFFMMEEHTAYEIKSGELLVLEPGATHWGHLPCREKTEVYWIHFIHQGAKRVLEHDQVEWLMLLRKNTDFEEDPTDQSMYLPKHSYIDPSILVPLLERMSQLFHSFSVRNALPLNSLLFQILEKLQSVVQRMSRSRSMMLSERVMEYLEKNANVPFQSKLLEEALHFHVDYLTRCLKKHTGMSPLQYQRRIQIDQAKMLLEATELTITEISERIGIGDSSYFNRIFRQTLGVTPTQYRQKFQAIDASGSSETSGGFNADRF